MKDINKNTFINVKNNNTASLLQTFFWDISSNSLSVFIEMWEDLVWGKLENVHREKNVIYISVPGSVAMRTAHDP